jgi:hypothetical protein
MALSDQIRGCLSALDALRALGKASLAAPDPATTADQMACAGLVGHAEELLEGASISLSDEVVNGLAALADHPLAPQALLTAFDEKLGAQLALEFQSHGGEMKLARGDPFPIARHHLGDLYGGGRKFTPRPLGMARPWRRLQYFGVWERPGGCEASFDFGSDAFLSRFIDNPCIAVLHLNASEAEFDLDTSEERGKFFHVRPVDEQEQRRRVEQLLTAADASSRAHVVLLPELSVTPGIAAEIGEFVRHRAKSVRVAVAGSYHVPGRPKPATADGSNLLEIHAAAAPAPRVHRKFNPYELERWREKTYRPPLLEDIAAPPQMTVRLSGGWSFVTLICKDFLEQGTLAALDALQPNFVFVSSMSQAGAPFVTNAAVLALRCQSTVVVSNFGPTVAMAAAPLAAGGLGEPTQITLSAETAGAAPTLWVLQLNDRFEWRIPEV